MIRVKKIYNFIKVCEIYYETESVVMHTLQTISHHSARIYSYESLALPHPYVLSRVKTTSRIALKGKTVNQVLALFRKNYRNEIRKTYSDNKFSFVLRTGYSKDGYKLYSDFEKQAKRFPCRKKDADGLWALGYIDGKLVSGIFLIDAAPVMKIVSIFSARKHVNDNQKKEIGYVGKRLMYEVCNFGLNNNFEYVDLAYVHTNIVDEVKAGITTYKLGFGGDITEEYLYEKDTKVVIFLKLLRKILGI